MLRSSLGACVVLLLVACGCNGSARERPANPPVNANQPTGSGSAPAGSGSSGTTMSNPPVPPVSVEALVTGTRPGRPPLQRLVVDVTLANAGDAPRWITIAKQIPPNPDTDGGGVDSLEVRGTAPALLGTFRGVAGVHALRLAGHAKVRITNLEVGWWRSSATDPVPGLDVMVADDLTIGGAPAKDWFGVEPLFADGATVDATGTGTDAHATNGPEAMITLVGAVPSSTALALPKP